MRKITQKTKQKTRLFSPYQTLRQKEKLLNCLKCIWDLPSNLVFMVLTEFKNNVLPTERRKTQAGKTL